VHGWNFVDNNNQVQDPHGHGTHIAGIIAGRGPVLGVSKNSKIMVLRYFDHKQRIDMLESTVQAMRYAIRNGAKIINYSAGGTIPSRLEEEVVKLALKEKVLIVAAAGNEATDTDVSGFFPASYSWPHILSVASVDSSLHLARQSNFGGRTVRIAAPGERIVSLLPGGKFGMMSGTSQATAFVTGAAAEIMAHSVSRLDPIQIVDRLVVTGTQLQSLRGRTQFATLLNVKRAWSSSSGPVTASTDLGLRN
jgi:subtilisin family serine protease